MSGIVFCNFIRCSGSSWSGWYGFCLGVGNAGQAAAGVVTEDPSNLRRFCASASRVHRGIYGLLVGFITPSKIGLLGGGVNMDMSMTQGLLYFAACIPIGIVGLISARYQGETAATSIGIVGKETGSVR